MRGSGELDWPSLVVATASAVVVWGSALLLGGALPVLYLPFAAISLLLAATLVLQQRKRTAVSVAPVILMGCLGAYSLLQSLPLPISWVSALSPMVADIWQRALLPAGKSIHSASLSLDPAASLFEAIKWASYAAVFLIGSRLSQRRGAFLGLAIVFGSAVLLALVSLGHAVAGATTVFGLYTPTFQIEPGRASPLVNPNNLAGYLNLGALIGMGLMFSRKPPASRWALGTGLAIVVAMSIRTASRGGILTLLVGLGLFAALIGLNKRRGPSSNRMIAYATSALLVVAAAIAVVGGDHIFWASLVSENFEKFRIHRWTIPLIRDHAWLGIGRGSFESVFPAYRPATPANIVFAHPENFALQWASEWGIPVSVAASAAWTWFFGFGRLGITRSSSSAGALCGVVALLLQNLVDLSLELPAVGVATALTLGCLWGGAPRRQKHRPSRWTPIVLAGAFIGSLVLIPVLLVRGPSNVASDRHTVRRLLQARIEDPSAFNREQLHTAIIRQVERHPADYYFPLVGAFEARLDGGNPIPWIQRALERGPTVGRTHVLLGEVLLSRGLRSQGFMELRMGYEHEPPLAKLVAGIATKHSQEARELMRVVPDGQPGVMLLTEIATLLTNPTDAADREVLDMEALQRDPALIDQRSRVVDARLKQIQEGAPICSDAERCWTEIEGHINELGRYAPSSTRSVQYRARVALARGNPNEALAMLEEGCQRPVERDVCLRLRIDALQKAGARGALATALESYPDAVCVSPSSCAGAHAWVGQFHAQLGNQQQAVSSLEKAARAEPTAARWLELADAAVRAGLRNTASMALQEAAARGATRDQVDARTKQLDP